MSFKVTEYETNNFTWRDDFEKAYVEWVDLQLIGALLKSIDSSVRALCKAVNDTSKWPSRINRSLRTVSYPRIRDVADYLGIPPWLLFSHKEKNTKIQELFNSINTVLKPIELPYFSEYDSDVYYDFLYELEKRVKTKEDFDILSKKLQGLQLTRSYHHIVSGNWKAVFGYFNDIHRDFDGGATFWYRDPDGILRGNLRVSFKNDPKNQRKLIKAGWLAIETSSETAKNSVVIDRFMDKAITDLEWTFEGKPWKFIFESGKTTTIILTWHTQRKSDEYFELASSLINPKLPEANFSMNISERFNGVFDSTFRNNPFEELIQLIKADVKSFNDSKKTRRRNSLQLLCDRGILHDVDIIILVSSNKTADLVQDEFISKAEIKIENGKPSVRWMKDNNIYSISKLTQIVLIEIALQTQLYNHHLNGAEYWRLPESEKSLYSLANAIYKLEKTCQ